MDDFQKLVYVRLQSFPSGYNLSIGSKGDITKEEALRHVANNDEIGQTLIRIEREYFNTLRSGQLYAGITN